jgi:hypothetical protein
MKLIPFCLLTALSLLYVALTFAESEMYETWDMALKEQRALQIKLAYYQRANAFIEALLKRLAVDSQHDPALAELLKQNQIKVVVTDPNNVRAEAQPPQTEPAPAASPASTNSTTTPAPR